MITSILSALLFYLVPFCIGRGLFGWFRRIRELPLSFITYSLLGGFVLFSIAVVMELISPLFGENSFIDIYPLITHILFGLSLPINVVLLKKDPIHHVSSLITIVLNSLIISGIVFAVWAYKSPYPLNWDLYEHQTLATIITRGNFNVLPSHLSDTFGFDGYTTAFHTLLSISQSFLPFEILTYWHAVSFFHLLLIVIASYIFTKSITESDSTSFAAAVLGGFIFESSVAYTSLFLIPQTISALFGAFLIAQLIASIKKKIPIPPFVIITSLFFIFINHFIVGLCIALLYFFIWACLTQEERIKKIVTPQVLLQTGIALGIFGVFLSYLLPMGSFNQGESQFYLFDISQKAFYMRNAYGYLLIIFLPLGILHIGQHGKKEEKIALAAALFFLLLMMNNIPYVLKFYTVGRFFIHTILAIGIASFLSRIRNTVLNSLAVVVLVLVLLVVFILNVSYWKNILSYTNSQTHISSYEIEASEFLKKNYKNTDTLIISDPATSYLMESLSGINSPGGAYMNRLNRNYLSQAEKTENTEQKSLFLSHINDSMVLPPQYRLFVVSGRYFAWQNFPEKEKMEFYFNAWSPKDLTFDNYIQAEKLVADSAHFRLVYQNPTVIIFEVN